MTVLKREELSDLDKIFQEGKPVENHRFRELSSGGFLFKKNNGSWRFFSVLSEAVLFEYCEDELL